MLLAFFITALISGKAACGLGKLNSLTHPTKLLEGGCIQGPNTVLFDIIFRKKSVSYMQAVLK